MRRIILRTVVVPRTRSDDSAKKKDKKPEAGFIFSDRLPQMILFVIGIFIITVWVNHHFSDTTWFTIGMYGFGVLYGVLGLLFRISNDPDGNTTKLIFRHALLFFLTPVLIFVLYASIIIVGSSISTVAVYGDGLGESVQVTITGDSLGIGSKTENLQKQGTLRFTRFTNPMGRSLVVHASGYLPKRFDLYPWIAHSIHVAEDLAPAPSLYIRGGKLPETIGFFVVAWPGNRDTIRNEHSAGALLIGRYRAVPDTWKEEWKLYLEATPDIPQENIPVMLQAWRTAVQRRDIQLMPGDTVTVSMLSRGKLLQSALMMTVGPETFQDFLIQPK